MTGLWWIFVIASSVLFLCGAVLAVRTCRRDTGPIANGLWLFLVLAGGLLVRAGLAATTRGYGPDIGTFSAWAMHAAEGLTSFYSPGFWADYPPGYIYVLWIVGKLHLAMGLKYGQPEFLLLLKFPAILADIATAWVLYRLARRYNRGAGPVVLAALYAFNPAVILDSAVWGQVDSVLTLFILLGVLLLDTMPEAAGAFFALALLVKPQALIFAPAPLLWFGVRLVRQRDKQAVLETLKFCGAFAVVFVLGVLPFVIDQPAGWIVSKYTDTMASYPYASLNAFNFFALLGANGAPMDERLFVFTYSQWGTVFLALVLAGAAVLAIRAKDAVVLWYLPVFLLASVFVLSAKMHERYLFPALALMLGFFIISHDRWVIWLFAGFSVTQFLNVSEVLALSYQGIYLVPRFSPLLQAVSLANVLLWVLLVWTVCMHYVVRRSTRPTDIQAAKAD